MPAPTQAKEAFIEPKNAQCVWEKPDFKIVSLGAEVTAYLGSDADTTPI